MESSVTNSHTCTNDYASGDNSLTSAQKKKITQASTKEITAALDSLLPPTSTTAPSQRKGGGGRSCGSRSFGRTGRSLLAILQDAAALAKLKRAHIDVQMDEIFDMRHKRAGVTVMDSIPGFPFYFSLFFGYLPCLKPFQTRNTFC